MIIPIVQNKKYGAVNIAAPSCVYPAHIPENSRKLSGPDNAFLDEIALTFFETKSCLEYDDEVLPEELAALPAQWSVHLPVDLPWSDPAKTAAAINTLGEKVAFLKPWTYVLHPPQETEQGNTVLTDVLQRLQILKFPVENILLENVEGVQLELFIPAAEQFNLGFCIDTGHLLGFKQQSLLEHEALLKRVRMVHIYTTPLDIVGHKHLALSKLDEKGRDLLYRIFLTCPSVETLTLEVFSPEALHESYATLRQWLK